MSFIKHLEGLELKVRDSDQPCFGEYNPNIELIMPLVSEHYGAHAQALYMDCGDETRELESYVKAFVKRLDKYANAYSKSIIRDSGRKYDLIIALDACEPLRKLSTPKRRLMEKALINNINRLLFRGGVALLEDDASRDLWKSLIRRFNITVIGNKFRIIVVEKK